MSLQVSHLERVNTLNDCDHKYFTTCSKTLNSSVKIVTLESVDGPLGPHASVSDAEGCLQCWTSWPERSSSISCRILLLDDEDLRYECVKMQTVQS